MSFAFPLGFLALGALGPLFLAYFLRRRQKPRVVSALFLWHTPSRRAEGGARFERFSRESSLLLETAAIVTAALFLANLHFGKDASRKHAVVVLDGGLSMRATTGAGSVVDRAVREVARVVADERADVLTVVESGPHPRVIAGPLADEARALAGLSQWRPSQPAHDFGPALMLARELATSKGQRISFVTDGPPSGDPAWPAEVEVTSVGTAADNFAFLSAQRRDEGGVAQVSLRVASFAKQKQTVAVVVSNQDVHQRESVDLDPGASAVVRLTLTTSAPLTATLPPDALAQDSELVLPPSPTTPVEVGLVAGLDPAAEAALRQFFAALPDARLSNQPTLTWGPPETNASVTLGAKGKLRSFVGPFFAEKSDPLLDDVRLSGIVWAAGNSPPGRPLISMGGVAMMSVEEDGRLHINVELSHSNVQRTTAWPVLLANVVRDARLKIPGFPRRMVVLGEEADVVIDSKGSYLLESPSGEKRPLFGALAAHLPLDEAGEWTLSKDGRPLDTLVVQPLDGRESDLSTRGKYEVTARAPSGTATGAPSPRARWLLGLLVVLLLVDAWITSNPSVSRGGLSLGRGGSK